MLQSIIDYIQNPITGFLDPDKYDGIVSDIAVWINVAIVFFAFVVFVVIASLLFRYPMRYVYHRARTRHLGGMVWNEVIYSGVTNQEEAKKSISQMQNMRHIMKQTMGGSLPLYYGRPMTSLMIRKSPDDSVHMYIGIDKSHYRPEHLSAWASGANCSVEEIDIEDIGFVASAPYIATNTGYDTTGYTDAPQNDYVGSVISKVQETVDGSDPGTILITFEPMRTSEENLFRNHAQNDDIKQQGKASIFSGVSREVKIMTSLSPSRAVIMAFSDEGDYNVSRSLLDTTISSIATLGTRVNILRPMVVHRRAGFYGFIASILFAALSWFGYFPWVLTVLTAVFSILTVFGASFMSDMWVAKAAKYGEGAIPPFFRYSLRRIAKQKFLFAVPFDIDSEKSEVTTNNYIAEPSCNEVIPVYQTPMMQFLSMPITGGNVANISSSAVPQISMESSTVQRIENFTNSDNVIYLGMSAKSHEPVFRTLKDINFGIAIGGGAGSGKTNTLINDFIGMCRMSRMKNSKAQINPIWFETKSDDIGSIRELAKPYSPVHLALHDQDSPIRLALEGKRLGQKGVTVKSVLENKNAFISAMDAVLGKVSFGPRSRQVANSCLTVALLINRDELESLGLSSKLENPSRPNIIHLMYLLIGGDSSINIKESIKDFAKEKALTISGANREDARAEMGEEGVARIKELVGALSSLNNLFSERDAVNPLLNKLPVFMESKGLFETVTTDGKPRKEYGIDKFYTRGGPVIVDMTPNNSTMDIPTAETFSMMVHYMMWQSMRKNCGGWAKQGKFTPIYADEITNFTGRADADSIGECANVIGVVRDQGRSFGISHNVGFQSFGQLPKDALNAVKSFDSLILLKFRSSDDQDTVMKQIGESTRYSIDNIKSFPQGIGIADMIIGRKQVKPFTIKSPEADEWCNILNSSSTVMEAFDTIYDSEMRRMKEERKKKVSSQPTQKSTIREEDEYAPIKDVDDDDDFTLEW